MARRGERLRALRQRIENAGGRAIYVEADVRDGAAMRAAFDAAERTFGTVTILVNNAGIAHSSTALAIAAKEWRDVLATNLDATFYCAQEGARRMLGSEKMGAIVNIASVLGLSADKGVAAYAAAKAGVIQLTKALAIERGFKGIRVNAIAPGWIATEMTSEYLNGRASAMKRQIPMGRFGDPADLDGALLLLVSDAGRYITGTTVVVDGGQLAALHV